VRLPIPATSARAKPSEPNLSLLLRRRRLTRALWVRLGRGTNGPGAEPMGPAAGFWVGTDVSGLAGARSRMLDPVPPLPRVARIASDIDVIMNSAAAIVVALGQHGCRTARAKGGLRTHTAEGAGQVRGLAAFASNTTTTRKKADEYVDNRQNDREHKSVVRGTEPTETETIIESLPGRNGCYTEKTGTNGRFR